MERKRPLPKDFAELLTAFAGAGVRYLLIGGYAVGFHEKPRTTKDIDLLVDASAANVRRACRALRDFRAPAAVIADFAAAAEDEITWFGVPPLRVDLLKSAPGVDFKRAWTRRAEGEWSGAPVHVLSREDLIVAKRAAGRLQDLADAALLERGARLRR